MSKQEISITEFELEDSKGHLAKLKFNWAKVPTISASVISESKGNSADKVKSHLESTNQVSDSFQVLLDNSLSFFSQMGIAFQESDEKASQNIDSIT